MSVLTVCLGLLLLVYLGSLCDGRDEIGHDDCSTEMLGAVWNHSLQTSTISQVQVPVIWPADGQLLCRCRCRTADLFDDSMRWTSVSTCSRGVVDKPKVLERKRGPRDLRRRAGYSAECCATLPILPAALRRLTVRYMACHQVHLVNGPATPTTQVHTKRPPPSAADRVDLTSCACNMELPAAVAISLEN